MPQPNPPPVKYTFFHLHREVVNAIVENAPTEWDYVWLNEAVETYFDEYRFNTIQDIVPFFNRLAHYTAHNTATDDGHVALEDIPNFVSEAIEALCSSIFETTTNMLKDKYGEPHEPI